MTVSLLEEAEFSSTVLVLISAVSDTRDTESGSA